MQSGSNREANNPADPWSWDAFSPSAERPAPALPDHPVRKRKPVPAQDELFTVQRDLVKALGALDDLERENSKADTRQLRTQLQNGYKVLNRYLRSHAT